MTPYEEFSPVLVSCKSCGAQYRVRNHDVVRCSVCRSREILVTEAK